MELTPEDYWKLRALSYATESVELEARKAADRFKAQGAQAQQRQCACYEAMAQKYGFDPATVYTFDDDACALVPATM